MVARSLLVNVPTVWLGVGLVAVSVGLSLLGLIVVRKKVALETLEAQHEVAGFLIAVVGVIYAVLLAFVVIIVWEQFGSAETAVGDEAAAVGSLYRDGVALGVQGQPLRAAVQRYAVSVVDVEWPYMATHLTENAQTDPALNGVWAAVTRLRSTNGTESSFVQLAVNEVVTATQDRRTRVRDSNSEIPAPLWLVLIGGGVITVAFTYFFGLESFRVQAVMVSALAAVIALSGFTILTLNLPFTGGVAIKPEAMHTEIDEFPAYNFR
jgi:hypothetical protein